MEHIPTAEERLWATRFKIVEDSNKVHRDNAAELVRDNEQLQSKMEQMERDSLEVVAFLKREAAVYQQQAAKLLEQLGEVQRIASAKVDGAQQDRDRGITHLQHQLAAKSDELDAVRQELASLHEFGRQRATLERRLMELKETNERLEMTHQQSLQRVEDRFADERVRAQKEMERQIAQLAERAHEEAVKKIDASARQAFKDNVALQEALQLHQERIAQQDRLLLELQSERQHALASQQENAAVVLKLTALTKGAEPAVARLTAAKDSMQTALNTMIREKGQQQLQWKAEHESTLTTIRVDLDETRVALDARTKELARVRTLARSLLEQRTDLEKFLVSSLSVVQQEIADSRARYVKEAKASHQREMLAATRSGAALPPIRTFGTQKDTASTNSVLADMDGADDLPADWARTDPKDMTWEQRERVLRLLMLRINSAPPPRPAPTSPRAPANPLQRMLAATRRPTLAQTLSLTSTTTATAAAAATAPAGELERLAIEQA